MNKTVVGSMKNFPRRFKNTITYDNGTKNAFHELTNKVFGTKSYFCNPYHSWEKGTVENLIGIVRRFYPKKMGWDKITQRDLNKVMRFINNRLVKYLGFKSPLQTLALAY